MYWLITSRYFSYDTRKLTFFRIGPHIMFYGKIPTPR